MSGSSKDEKNFNTNFKGTTILTPLQALWALATAGSIFCPTSTGVNCFLINSH